MPHHYDTSARRRSRSIAAVDHLGGVAAATLVNQTRGADLTTFRLLRRLGA